ncbi:hypothetical protein F906_00930 [Acinetobacter pseudolwoffii]|uniref:Uncharacterized protein n=1 Tax=Acinetobacter pseudolwoffii TaxID=2053287 RepID=N9KUG1_9GAMM|nr:hypothetical protein F906_00930 [Acinetobacter pseudolwoffii]
MIPSLPKHLLPKRLPFYFQFMPRLSIAQVQTQEELVEFRHSLQQHIYTGLAALTVQRQQDQQATESSL